MIAVALLSVTPLSAQITRSVDFTQNTGNTLDKNAIGGYCPQKWINADKVYSVANALTPLSMPFNRVNLPNGSNILSNGTWTDTSPSQKVILDNMIASGTGVHVGIESILPNSGIRGNSTKVKAVFNTSYDKVYSFVGNVPIDYEIFNEPDLSSVEWGYPDFNSFWNDFYNAYLALNAKRVLNPNLRIGGPGFLNNSWVSSFVTKLKSSNVKLDFISYHQYLDWRDAKSLDQYSGQAAIDRMNSMASAISTYKSTVNPAVDLYCTEFNWVNGDGGQSASLCGVAQNGYKNCARTLEAFKLVVDKLNGVEHFCWAQSVGQNNDFFTWNNYDWNSGKYSYRSGFYAMWMFQKMASKRNYYQDDAKIGGMASTYSDKHYLAIWNRSAVTQTVVLNMTLPNAASTYNYALYVINASTFSFVQGNKMTPTPVTGALSSLGNIQLTTEATAYLEITPK